MSAWLRRYWGVPLGLCVTLVLWGLALYGASVAHGQSPLPAFVTTFTALELRPRCEKQGERVPCRPSQLQLAQQFEWSRNTAFGREVWLDSPWLSVEPKGGKVLVTITDPRRVVIQGER